MAEISPVDPEILSGADSSLVDFGYDNFLRDILLPDSNVLFNDLSPSTLLPQEPSFSYSNNRTKTLGLNEREDSGAVHSRTSNQNFGAHTSPPSVFPGHSYVNNTAYFTEGTASPFASIGTRDSNNAIRTYSSPTELFRNLETISGEPCSIPKSRTRTSRRSKQRYHGRSTLAGRIPVQMRPSKVARKQQLLQLLEENTQELRVHYVKRNQILKQMRDENLFVKPKDTISFETDDSCMSTEATTLPSAFEDHMDTSLFSPISNRNFTSDSQNSIDSLSLASALTSQTDEHPQEDLTNDIETPRLTTSRRTMYHCTYIAYGIRCNYSTSRKKDWERHEVTQQHWQQFEYLCFEATECSGRSFSRFEKLRTHLEIDHGIQRGEAVTRAQHGTIPVESNWPRQCGFCGRNFQTWDQRIDDVAKHFEDGFDISTWRLPFQSRRPGDERLGLPPRNQGDDDDDDDDDGTFGYGGKSQQVLCSNMGSKLSGNGHAINYQQSLDSVEGRNNSYGHNTNYWALMLRAMRIKSRSTISRFAILPASDLNLPSLVALTITYTSNMDCYHKTFQSNDDLVSPVYDLARFSLRRPYFETQDTPTLVLSRCAEQYALSFLDILQKLYLYNQELHRPLSRPSFGPATNLANSQEPDHSSYFHTLGSLSHKQELELAAHLLQTTQKTWPAFGEYHTPLQKAVYAGVSWVEKASIILQSIDHHLGGFPNQANGYVYNERLKTSYSQKLSTQEIVGENLPDQDYLPHKVTHGVENLPAHNAQKFKGKVTGVKARQNAISFDNKAEISKMSSPRMPENASQSSFYSSRTASASKNIQEFDLEFARASRGSHGGTKQNPQRTSNAHYSISRWINSTSVESPFSTSKNETQSYAQRRFESESSHTQPWNAIRAVPVRSPPEMKPERNVELYKRHKKGSHNSSGSDIVQSAPLDRIKVVF